MGELHLVCIVYTISFCLKFLSDELQYRCVTKLAWSEFYFKIGISYEDICPSFGTVKYRGSLKEPSKSHFYSCTVFHPGETTTTVQRSSEVLKQTNSQRIPVWYSKRKFERKLTVVGNRTSGLNYASNIINGTYAKSQGEAESRKCRLRSQKIQQWAAYKPENRLSAIHIYFYHDVY